MLCLHVTIYTVDETFSVNKDFEWALVEETSKTLIDFSGEQDFGFAFFQRLLSFQYLSLWMLRVSDHSEINVSKQYCASSRTSPQLPKPMLKQLSQSLALCCMYLKWNPESSKDHRKVLLETKGEANQRRYFCFHPFYLEHIKGGWEVKSSAAEQN